MEKKTSLWSEGGVFNDMKCPYCSAEMVSGFMQNVKPISWTPHKIRLFTHSNFTEKGAVVLSEGGGLDAPCIVAYNCPSCRKIIIEYGQCKL